MPRRNGGLAALALLQGIAMMAHQPGRRTRREMAVADAVKARESVEQQLARHREKDAAAQAKRLRKQARRAREFRQ